MSDPSAAEQQAAREKTQSAIKEGLEHLLQRAWKGEITGLTYIATYADNTRMQGILCSDVAVAGTLMLNMELLRLRMAFVMLSNEDGQAVTMAPIEKGMAS